MDSRSQGFDILSETLNHKGLPLRYDSNSPIDRRRNLKPAGRVATVAEVADGGNGESRRKRRELAGREGGGLLKDRGGNSGDSAGGGNRRRLKEEEEAFELPQLIDGTRTGSHDIHLP